MKLNIDLKNKKGSLDVNAEKIIEKGMDQHEKDWKDKFNTKHNAKKEIMELKHKQKIENKEQDLKKKSVVQEVFDGFNSQKQIEFEEQQKIEEEKRKVAELAKENKNKRTISIVSIVLFFIYGLFCITGFKDSHIISAVVSLIQIALVTISILSSLSIVTLFKNDYKICLLISLMLIIPWLAFAI